MQNNLSPVQVSSFLLTNAGQHLPSDYVESLRASGRGKRITLTGGYTLPSLPYKKRLAWRMITQNKIAQMVAAKEKGVPHKAWAVLDVVGRFPSLYASHERIGELAGCCSRTVGNVMVWAEKNGFLSWAHRAKISSQGLARRTSNLYYLALDAIEAALMEMRLFKARHKGNRCLESQDRDSNRKRSPVDKDLDDQKWIDEREARWREEGILDPLPS